jgi:hypothetical protein
MRVGIPELMILLVVGVLWIVPIGVCVWAVVTLSRVKTTQEEIGQRLLTIERARRGPTG